MKVKTGKFYTRQIKLPVFSYFHEEIRYCVKVGKGKGEKMYDPDELVEAYERLDHGKARMSGIREAMKQAL